MPYKDKQAKADHNKEYKRKNSELLTIHRIIRLKQKTITENTYDKIKSFVDDDSFWENVTVRKSLQQSTKEAIQNVVSQEPTPKTTPKQTTTNTKKYSVADAKKWINEFYTVNKTKATYLSRVNPLVKLVCKEDDKDDFMCIYKKTSIALIKEKYKTPKAYFDFMLIMIQNNPEVSKRVSETMHNLLKKADSESEITQDANTLRESEERDATTDFEELYNKMVKKDVSKLNDDEKLIRAVYIDGIYDNDKVLQMIPRNYLYEVKLIKTNKENDEKGNFYMPTTGQLIINDFKTKGKYQPVNYKINTKVKKMIDNNLAKNPKKKYLFENGGRDQFNLLIKNSLGFGVNDYRRIMKFHNEQLGYTLEELAHAMKDSVRAGETSYTATRSLRSGAR